MKNVDECHGSWEENGTGYLIASPLSRSSTSARRYCFIYSEADEGLRVSSSSETCRRNVSPGVEAGVWAFNLTVDGKLTKHVHTLIHNYHFYIILIFLSDIFQANAPKQ